MAKLENAELAYAYLLLFGGPASLLSAKGGGLDLFVLDAPHLYDRPGNPYLGPDGLDWPDNATLRRACRVGADIGKGVAPAYSASSRTPTTGRRRWSPAYLHYDGGARPGRR